VDQSGKKIPGLFVADSVGDISVDGGSIHVNTIWEAMGANETDALHVKAGGDMSCARLTITGHTDPAPGSSDWASIWEDDLGIEVPYDIWEGAPYMPDPLRAIEPPNIADYEVKSYVHDTSATLYEGYYPDGIELNSTGTLVTLNPGTYILGGGHLNQDSGLKVNGGTLIAHGVLIYLTKDYGDDLIIGTSDDGRWAQLDIEGNVVTDITPPGDYMNPRRIDGLPGISIWQDRVNTENIATLNGQSGITISGTLYFPNNHIYLAGNPGKTGNQILCGSCEVFGRAQILVEYDGRNNNHKGVSVLVK
jgi:hypothetical protein